jgi:hypothetical protein
MGDAHPLVSSDLGEPEREHGATVVLSTARLIVGRCDELRELVDLYDVLVDQLHADDDML